MSKQAGGGARVPLVAVEDQQRQFAVFAGAEGVSTLPEPLGDPQGLGGPGGVRGVLGIRGDRRPAPEHETAGVGIVRLVHDQPPQCELAKRRIHLPVFQPGRHPEQFPDVHRVRETVGPGEIAGQHPAPHLGVERDQRLPRRLRPRPGGAATGGTREDRDESQCHPDPVPPHRPEDSGTADLQHPNRK